MIINSQDYLRPSDLHERSRAVTERDRMRWYDDDRFSIMPGHLVSFDHLEIEEDYDVSDE